MSHYDKQYEEEYQDYKPTCTFCCTDNYLTNTSEHGWICESCSKTKKPENNKQTVKSA